VDWTESPIASANYVVTDDVEPPTITVSFSSLPNAQGWYLGDVTATFTCEDPSGIKWCTPPTRIGGEGFELPVVANAVDVWGNHSMAAWTINIDRTPPDLRIYTPKNNSHVQSGTTSITVRGGAHDLSGVDEVLCNGVVATVVDDAFVCGVAVGEGLNTITVEASDRAGHTANTELSVIVGDVTVRAVDVSPATLTMFVGDTREIFVKDQEGGERHDGTWSISDSAIATVVDADGATTISALDAGQTTLIVTINGGHRGRDCPADWRDDLYWHDTLESRGYPGRRPAEARVRSSRFVHRGRRRRLAQCRVVLCRRRNGILRSRNRADSWLSE
jgi:hypothetical protein